MATIKKTTMPKKKMAEGGPTATTKTRKTLSGGTRTKTVSGNTVNITKTDKAGNIIKNKTRNRMQGWDESEAGGNSSMAKRGGSIKKKMAYGGVAKKTLRKANNGTTVGSTTSTTIPKQSPMTPLTEAEKRKLQVRWEQVNKRPLPPNTDLTPSSENFRTGAGPYSVNITPNQKRGGATKKKMAKGGATSFGMLSVKAGIDKNPGATAADRIAGAKKNKRKKS
jgi:hypothetical protein